MVTRRKPIDAIWNKIMRQGKPIVRNKIEDCPFNVSVTGSSNDVTISVRPDPVSVTNEALPIVSTQITNLIGKFEGGKNTKENRLKLEQDMIHTLQQLWEQGLIKPKEDNNDTNNN